LHCRGDPAFRGARHGRPQDTPTIETIVPLTFYEIIIYFMICVHPETCFSPPHRRGRGRVIKLKNFKAFYPYPPHPAPLPQGDREFPDEN